MIARLARLLLRTVFLLLGLLFLLGLLAAALLLLVFWLVQALWARLTGRPVQPLVFTLLRRARWERFHRPANWRQEGNDDVIDVPSRSVDAARIPTDRA